MFYFKSLKDFFVYPKTIQDWPDLGGASLAFSSLNASWNECILHMYAMTMKLGTIVLNAPEIIHPSFKNRKMRIKLFLASILFDPSKVMFLAHFQPCLEVRTKTFGISAIFNSPLLWPAKRRGFYCYQLSNF